jgi:hypothetical protein
VLLIFHHVVHLVATYIPGVVFLFRAKRSSADVERLGFARNRFGGLDYEAALGKSVYAFFLCAHVVATSDLLV